MGKMYDFSQTEVSPYNNTKLPSFAPKFNNTLVLENEIEGFRTTSVEGRESLEISLDTQQLVEGVDISGRTSPGRTISVHFLLRADDDSMAAQDAVTKLKSILYNKGEEHAVQFADEPYTYYARLVKVSVDSVESNNFLGTYELFCSTQYKYGEVVTNTTGYVPIKTYFDCLPDYITIEVTGWSGVASYVKFTSGDATIQLGGLALKPKDIIIVDFQKMEVTVNGKLKNRLMTLTSQTEIFYLIESTTIQASWSGASGIVTYTMREWRK